MSELYERIKSKAELTLKRSSEVENTNLKGGTIRLLPEYFQLIDKLAEQFGESRQVFLSGLIYDAVDEALNAYASVFEDSSKVTDEIRKSCGFIYGNATQTQFIDFCHLNHLHPDDSDSMFRFQEVTDYVREQNLLKQEFSK